MRRFDLNLDEDKIAILSGLPGTVSEHIRRALDMYLESLQPKVAQSASVKGGNTDGK